MTERRRTARQHQSFVGILRHLRTISSELGVETHPEAQGTSLIAAECAKTRLFPKLLVFPTSYPLKNKHVSLIDCRKPRCTLNYGSNLRFVGDCILKAEWLDGNRS